MICEGKREGHLLQVLRKVIHVCSLGFIGIKLPQTFRLTHNALVQALYIYIYLNVYTLHISFLPFLIHYMHILYVCRNLHKTTISRVFGAKGIDHCCLGFCVHVCKRVCVCFRLIRGFVEGPLFLKQYFPLFPFFSRIVLFKE